MRDFKYIIWHQGKSSTDESTMLLVDNNNEQVVLSEGERVQVFEFISASSKSHNGEKHKWVKMKIVNPSTKLKVYTDNMGNVLLSSHYVESDDNGRRIVFIFCTKKMKWDEIAKMLSLAASAVGKTVSESDLDIIKSIKQKGKLNLLLALSFTIVIIYILWKIFQA